MNNSILYRVRCFVKNFFRGIKYRRQRARRGYSDRDLWDIGEYLSTIVPPMMRHLKDNGSGYPVKIGSRKKWEEILEDIAKGFEAQLKLKVNYSKRYNENGKELEELLKTKDKGLKLFIKYLGAFWS
jgi:hypothetical protein